jgi:hypothetical protein
LLASYSLLGKFKICCAIIAASLLVGFAVPTTPAIAKSNVDRIIEEVCGEERLQGNYSATDLLKARDELPSDEEEYRDARSILDRAIAGAVKSGGKSGGTGGADRHGGSAAQESTVRLKAETPAEQEALANSARELNGPVKVGGKVINPGASTIDTPFRSLPGIVIAVLIVLTICIVCAFVPPVRRYVSSFAKSKRLGR